MNTFDDQLIVVDTNAVSRVRGEAPHLMITKKRGNKVAVPVEQVTENWGFCRDSSSRSSWLPVSLSTAKVLPLLKADGIVESLSKTEAKRTAKFLEQRFGDPTNFTQQKLREMLKAAEILGEAFAWDHKVKSWKLTASNMMGHAVLLSFDKDIAEFERNSSSLKHQIGFTQ